MRPTVGYWLTGVVSAALLVIYLLPSPYLGAVALFTDWATPLLAGVATLAALSVAWRYGLTTGVRFARVWQLFSLGMGVWFLGELTWAIYVLVLDVPLPYPSAADVFYISGYVFFGAGLFGYVLLFRKVLTAKKTAAASLLCAAGALLTAWVLIVPVASSPEDPLTWALDFAYPSLDILLLAGAIFGLAIFIGGKLGRSWLVLILAVVFDFLGDVTFSIMSANGTYYSGSVSDFFFLWSYALFTLAFYVHRTEL